MEETVTLSLKQYNELIETKKKYEASDMGNLECEIQMLETKNQALMDRVSYLAGKNETIKNEDTNFWLKYFRDLANRNENVFGYVKASKIYSAFLELTTRENEYKIDKPYPQRFNDIKIALNETETLKDIDVLKLQTDIERVIRLFLANNPSFKEGYELNFSIDDLPSLLDKGEEFASSDVALTILDKDNNKIIESI